MRLVLLATGYWARDRIVVSHQAKLHIPCGEAILSPISWMRKSSSDGGGHLTKATQLGRGRVGLVGPHLSGFCDTQFHMTNLGSFPSSLGSGTEQGRAVARE